jgi:hypothetical protein
MEKKRHHLRPWLGLGLLGELSANWRFVHGPANRDRGTTIKRDVPNAASNPISTKPQSVVFDLHLLLNKRRWINWSKCTVSSRKQGHWHFDADGATSYDKRPFFHEETVLLGSGSSDVRSLTHRSVDHMSVKMTRGQRAPSPSCYICGVRTTHPETLRMRD